MASSSTTSLDLVKAPGWEKYPWLVHGFSTRTGGKSTVYRANQSDLNLGVHDSDDRAAVVANRRLFVDAAAEGKEFSGLVTLRQIHSSLIQRVSRSDVQDSS